MTQLVVAQINTPSGATRPFNSNDSYEFGIMPTNLPSGGTFGKSSAAATAYNSWRNRFVRDCAGGSKRVLFDDNTSTVSEGIAYGMLLSAYAADKETFDGLWQFYLEHLDQNGVMNWMYSNCTNRTGTGGATDAELDAAMALIIAEEQWPNINTPYDYESEAETLISAIRRFEIHPNSHQTVNGDLWGFNNPCRNPSYFSPAYYREYLKVETSQVAFWNSTITETDRYLLVNRNNSTGLVSNWADPSGQPNGCNGPNEYGFDACRNPWRMANDVLWNGTSTATTAADICSKVAAWSNGNGGNLRGPLPQNASNPSVGRFRNGTFSTYALAAMAAGTSFQGHLNTSYNGVVSLGNNETYFNSTLRAITLFMLTGNFWQPGSETDGGGNNGGGTDPEPTTILGVPNTITVPVIDGNIDPVWSQVAGQDVEKLIVGSVSNSNDLSGAFRLMWDDNNLYILGEITDDNRINDSEDQFQDDAIEIAFDFGNDKRTTFGNDDVLYTFGWNDNVIGSVPANYSKQGIVFSIIGTNNGYNFEAGFPWSTLGGNASEDQLHGFDFQINDDDNGQNRDGKLSWNAAEDEVWRNPSFMGTIRLEDILVAINGEEGFESVSTYPNPFTDVLFIEGVDQADYSFVDLSGRTVQTGSTNGEIKANFESGVYNLILKSDIGTRIIRVVKN